MLSKTPTSSLEDTKENTSEEKINRKTGLPMVSLSTIICPFPKCTHYCVKVKEEDSLAGIFGRHVKTVHKVNPSKYCLDLIQSKINEFKAFKKYRYLDPFLHVSIEDVTRSK